MDIIIGQGAAGTMAAATLKKLGREVTVITNETDWYYSRIDLPDIVSGKYRPADATLRTAGEFAGQGIHCLMGETVAHIKLQDKTLAMASGQLLSYDKLLLATGGTPVVPPIAGWSLPGIYCLWTMAQARRIVTAAAKAKTAVVIGAGLIGIKTALALKKRGLTVTVVEKMPRILPLQLDETAADIIRRQVEAAGVQILTGVQVAAFKAAAETVSTVALSSGQELACDLVVAAVGVKPNTGLAQAAGIKVRHGIVTSSLLATSAPDIYAAGDVAEVPDSLSGGHVLSATWPAAVEQGMVAARNMAGFKTGYAGYLAMNSVDIAGIPVVSAGDIFGAENDEIHSTYQSGVYRRIVLRNKVIRGLLFVGEVRHSGVLVNSLFRQINMADIAPFSTTFSFADLLAI